MTSDSSTATEGPTAGTSGGGSDNSFPHRRSLPWAQVVRGGGEPDSVSRSSPPPLTEPTLGLSDQLRTVIEQSPQPVVSVEHHVEGVEDSSNDNESGVKKCAWNKPLANGGVVEGSSTPVMGAASWPALSELSRPKSLDGSVANSQASITSQAQQKPVKTNTSQHSNQNHNHTVRQRSTKRGGGVGGNYNRLPPPPPPMPPYPLYTTPYGGFVPVVLDTQYNGNSFVPARPVAGIGSLTQPVHDHSFNRKRNDFGPRSRGDGGPYSNNGSSGRWDHHDREWFGPRSHGGVVPHHGAPPPPPLPRGYMQQAHLGPAPFIAPQPIRPFGAPVGYDMPPPPPIVFGPPLFPRASSLMDPLSVSIRHQIEYYFSDDNLVKDHYLRSNINEEGWVPVKLIAGFHRVKSLTTDLQMVLSSIQDSTVVEVQGETIRRRNDWKKWLTPSVNFSPSSSTQSQHATTDGLVIQTSLQKLSLDESRIDDHKIIDTKLSDSIQVDEVLTTSDESMNPNSSYQDA
ncbi:hypothetical protein QVD17_42108 [Tagetes erecta]|uniref:HTH La-type RNA-binding domain-containing protein n=1 Tax=Tagetes erecta TaxID=13708 RepID=A0AAD8JNJ7_TARER|nr:hypothetical protein QVD17_42108 [Tagetes erecta]